MYFADIRRMVHRTKQVRKNHENVKSFLFRHRKAASTVARKPLPINDDVQNVRDYDTNRFHDDPSLENDGDRSKALWRR